MSAAPLFDSQNGLPANPRRPVLLHDYRFLEEAAYFDLEHFREKS